MDGAVKHFCACLGTSFECIPRGTSGKYLEEKSVSLSFLGEWKGNHFSFL